MLMLCLCLCASENQPKRVVFLMIMIIRLRLCASENSKRHLSGFVLLIFLLTFTLMSRVFSLVMPMLCLCASENQPSGLVGRRYNFPVFPQRLKASPFHAISTTFSSAKTRTKHFLLPSAINFIFTLFL